MSIPHSTYNTVTSGATFTGAWKRVGDGMSFHVHDAGNTGTIAVEVSNDPRCDPNSTDTASAKAVDITSALSVTDPAGSETNQLITVDAKRAAWVRLKYTHSSGTAAQHVWVGGV